MRALSGALLAVCLLAAAESSGQSISAVRSPHSVVYVDANGILVGFPAAGQLESPQLAYRLNGTDLFLLELQLTSPGGNRLRWLRTPIFYEGPACTGRALTQAATVRPYVGRQISVVEYTTSHLLISAPDPQPEPGAPQTVQDDDGLCKIGTANGPFVVVSPSGVDLDDVYVEPFRLDVRRMRPWVGLGEVTAPAGVRR